MHLFLSLITPLLGGKKVVFAPPGNLQESLRFILELVAKGKFQPVIDRTYRLEKIVEAFTYVATGEKVGNVIITMNE
jgi:NADPH:quinone reductase-like Zn-dependent oxidoreductase